jgi:hypothetical protein
MDLDFTARFAVDADTEARLVRVVTNLGYSLSGNTFININGNPFTVEFPKGPASVGDEVLQEFSTIREGKRVSGHRSAHRLHSRPAASLFLLE